MKKITFKIMVLAVCSLTVGNIQGQEWNVSNDNLNALGELTETVTVDGLTIYANADKPVTIDTNGKTLDDWVFTHRLKLGGSGQFDGNTPLGRVLAVSVDGDSEITVAAMSSSSSSDRELVITDATRDTIAIFPAMGSSITKGTYTYEGDATTLFFYSPSSGVNVYYLKVEAAVTGNAEVFRNNSSVNIYPNPATDKVYVDSKEPVQVAIYNLTGKMVKSRFMESSQDFISVDDLAPGVYFIGSQNNKSFAKKFIKK